MDFSSLLLTRCELTQILDGGHYTWSNDRWPTLNQKCKCGYVFGVPWVLLRTVLSKSHRYEWIAGETLTSRSGDLIGNPKNRVLSYRYNVHYKSSWLMQCVLYMYVQETEITCLGTKQCTRKLLSHYWQAPARKIHAFCFQTLGSVYVRSPLFWGEGPSLGRAQ